MGDEHTLARRIFIAPPIGPDRPPCVGEVDQVGMVGVGPLRGRSIEPGSLDIQTSGGSHTVVAVVDRVMHRLGCSGGQQVATVLSVKPIGFTLSKTSHVRRMLGLALWGRPVYIMAHEPHQQIATEGDCGSLGRWASDAQVTCLAKLDPVLMRVSTGPSGQGDPYVRQAPGATGGSSASARACDLDAEVLHIGSIHWRASRQWHPTHVWHLC